MDKTQAELDSLVRKEPRLVGGRVAKHDLPLTNEQIANPPKAPDYVNPTTRGGSAVPLRPVFLSHPRRLLNPQRQHRPDPSGHLMKHLRQ